MSLWAALIVLAVLVLSAPFIFWPAIVPRCPTWRTRAVRCSENLHEIAAGCRIYAESVGHRAYPWAEPGGLASLQALADAEVGLSPLGFICPATVDVPAQSGPDGKYRLEDGHSSYEMVPWKLTQSDPPGSIVAFDRTHCHEGGRNVIYLDGRIKVLDEKKFQEALARQAAGRAARTVMPPAKG